MAKKATKTEEFMRTLKCVLTERDVLQYARESADKQNEAGQLKSKLKLSATEIGGKVKGLASEIAEQSQAIRCGYEFRQVKCHRTYDYAKSQVVEKRLDSGCIIAERKMTTAESQMEMDLNTGEKQDAKSKS